MKTGIALIGFMGTGKTVVGRLLAEKLGKRFIELDAEIEIKAGKTVAAIFREDGEACFRKMEAQITADISTQKNTVVACGGGIVLDKANVFRLKQEYVIVCLSAAPADILTRISGEQGTRPLLDVADKGKKIEELLADRRPLYGQAAEITVNASGIDPAGVAQKIVDALSKYESQD
jgi:shikimate kinase / 3-dehydroquinate synthase